MDGNRKWWALVALSVAAVAIGLDMTVLNLALPTLSTALHATNNQLLWFVDAYTLVLAAAMLPAGMLGDKIGRKKLLLFALVVFGGGSLACAYATSAGMFIAARILLGLGAAFIVPLALSVIPVLFDEKARPKAVALLMVSTMISFPLGPILGGWLLTHYWWGTVFWINVPVVIIALFTVGLTLPETRAQEPHPVDLIGMVTTSLGLTGLTYGVIEGGENGFGTLSALIPILASAILFAACVVWERRASHPLIDFELFQSRGFTWGTILTTLVSFVMFGILFSVPQYFQEVLSLTPLQSGVRLLPLIIGLIAGAVPATRLAAWAGPKVAVGLGFAVLTVGVIIGANTSLQAGTEYSILWLTISGLGLGFAMPTAMDAALGALSSEHSGVGSAMIQAVRQAGGTMGVAVLGTILASVYRHNLITRGLPQPVVSAAGKSVAAGVAVSQQLNLPSLFVAVKSSFVDGMDVLLWLSAVIAVLNVVLALVFLPGRQTKGGAAE
ncbi:DHA2 family efflux MFS transporter permease subunit [Alicyclobacillus curvatus]|nr:DHA2 family efflux MFS transporter permease subunit [Alicyclobacillus curvatus]